MRIIFWVYLAETRGIHRQNFPALAFGAGGIPY